MRVVMRRLPPALALGLTLAACSSGTSTATERYYDPAGLFSARLPAANDILVMPKQRVENSEPLLSGVLALPPQASPSPGALSVGTQPVTQQDTAIYAVFAVQTKAATSAADLGGKLLGSTITPTILSQRRIVAGGLHGVLAVADHRDQTDPTSDYTDASGFFLDGGPSGIRTVPLGRPGLVVRSGIGWPLG
jgi:hypothetical protein